ncbi:copper chaperone PCu(A)C [uncultured Aquabacterium sp.]|uniref:copper chaperone PCu(A)C n=1 Tax=Aquabacterium sp. TaxID=1872578 RepID=UPI0025F1F1B3|nr:copper chaperone PCu(A)C [uncultured Aquabacterium sp.]
MRRVATEVLSFRALVLGVCLALPGVAAVAADKAVPPAPNAEASAGVVNVQDAWIRATVKGQTATGGFMTLRSSQPLTLIGFSVPGVPAAELHEMKMEGDVMRMRAIKSLPLPTGQVVTLRPGGHHLMLMGLKTPLSAGSTVQLELKLRAEDGRVLTQTVAVPVQGGAPGGSGGMPMQGHEHPGHGHHH